MLNTVEAALACRHLQVSGKRVSLRHQQQHSAGTKNHFPTFCLEAQSELYTVKEGLQASLTTLDISIWFPTAAAPGLATSQQRAGH